ncbi:M48 family metallopeptidase (plasmid) [Mesorhizobium sp. B2-1-8]|uniref:M48 family metallopeptidase n=1 Tax=Mesorhizobium sp. B2-1-8 TaxID=2589967 RepID=UPI00112D940E|nr:SprT family zinc-dependent metalloprotease [Mesorhizobium sp. B2-1-8]UCI23019.1 M48 family metallopeptidase [Mesorhizobium sp. B2-1-8]
MTAGSFQIEYGNQAINFAIIRRDRKTLEIAVEPDMSVVVAAPFNAKIEDIKIKVRKRAAWVRRQQRYFAQFLPRTPERLYVAGETHLYLGRQYRLKVVPHIQDGVKLIRGFILVQTHFPDRANVTQQLVEDWYRMRAQVKFRERVELSLDRFSNPEAFRPAGLTIKSLAQRWGSMSPAGRLLLNRRLIQAPVDTIDYVITHELCHIAEPHHGAAFFSLLGRVMPDWEKRKLKLERYMA